MPERRSRSLAKLNVPPALRSIIRAAQAECPPGHAEALAALTALAQHKVPARGIFEPGVRDEPELFVAIEAVAKAHLEFGEARATWRGALKSAPLTFEQRDKLETAALQVVDVSDTAYFYTGLAFGLTFAGPWGKA
jgi:hypothetical protein